MKPVLSRQRLKPIAACLCLMAIMLTALEGRAEEHPNVVMIMCDDLGWGDVGFNGNTRIKTPRLDALAAESLVLDHFYAASAVCSPTRGSFLTGRHPSRYGIPTANAGHLPKEEITLAEMLLEQGYATGHFGKWHLGTLTTKIKDSNRGGPTANAREHFSPPRFHGYTTSFATEAKTPTYDPMWKPIPKASSKGWDFIPDLQEAVSYGTRYWDHQGKEVVNNVDGDDSRVIVDRAVQFIEQNANKTKPFLAVVWFHTPHLPVVASPRHSRLYADIRDSYTRNYYGCITAMDEQVGRLVDCLKRTGTFSNTLLTFCSDNGPEGKAGSAPGTAGPFRGRKRDLYEGGVRVPSLISWPRQITHGRRSDYPSVTSDYFPTITAILDQKLPPRPYDGRSLLPLIESGALELRNRPIGFAFGKKTSLVTDRYKLIYLNGDTTQPQLYDLHADPAESMNLAPSEPNLVQSLDSQLSRWLESCQMSARGDDYEVDLP